MGKLTVYLPAALERELGDVLNWQERVRAAAIDRARELAVEARPQEPPAPAGRLGANDRVKDVLSRHFDV